MVHQDFTKAVEKPIDLRQAVEEYRANERGARRVAFRSAKPDGWGITSRGHAALNDRQRKAQEIDASLRLLGHDELAQALKDEAVARWMIRCFEVAGGPIPGMDKGATVEKYYDKLFAAKRTIKALAGI